MSNRTSYEIAFQLGAKMNSSVGTAFANVNRRISETDQNVNDLNDGSGKLSKTLGKLHGAAMIAGTAFVALSAGLTKSIMSADDFEGKMKQIQAATGSSSTEMAKLKEISKNLYARNLGEDWGDLADAISKTRTATNLSGKALENATANALIYRDVFGEEVTKSIKTADMMTKSFGITNKQSYNLLAQGAQQGLNASKDLLDTVNEYSVYFKNAGLDAEAMFAVFKSASDSGVRNLDFVGDAVKEFGIIMKEDSDRSSNAITALGLDAINLRSQFAKGGEGAKKAFQTIMKSLGNIEDPLKRNQLGVELFGTKFEDLEADAVIAMGNIRNQFDMTKATMEEIGNIKYDTVKQALKGIGRQIELEVFIPLGQKALPIVQKFSDAFNKKIPKLKKSAISTFKALGKVINTVKERFASAINIIKPIFETIIGIIAPILYDAVAFIKNIWGQIKSFYDKNGAQLVQAWKNIFGAIAAVVKILAPVVLFILKSVWDNVKGVVQGALNVILGLVKIFSSLFTGDWAGVWEGVKKLFFGAIQLLWNLWNLLMIGKLVGSIKALAKTFFGFLKGLGSKISTNAQYYYHTFIDTFYKIGSGILKAVGKAFGAIFNVIKSAIQTYIQVFSTARTFGVKVFMSIVTAVKNAFITIYNIIKSSVGNSISTALNTVKGFIGNVGKFLSSLWANIVNIFNKIKTAMTSPFETLKSIVKSVVDTIKGLIGGMFDGVSLTGKGAINSLIMAANSLIGNMNGLSIDVPKWVPKIGGQSFGFNIPKIPMLADGGITTGPTLAMIGEGSEQEAVLPLSKLESLLNSPGTTNINNNSQPFQYVDNRKIIIQGNADETVINKALKVNESEIEAVIKRILEKEKRLAF